jgi:hypothetical protein
MRETVIRGMNKNGKATNRPQSLRDLAPHSGHPSQPFSDAINRNVLVLQRLSNIAINSN